MTHYQQLLQFLTDRQYDFDLGDEYILERNGRPEQGVLICGNQSYEIIILSSDMKNMRSSTCLMLSAYLDQGGKVICVGSPGNYVEGMLNRENWQK